MESYYDRQTTFLRKLKEFESLIRFASRRYHIPGRLDPEDLYQAGCMILDDLIQNSDIDPDLDREDFRKIFKTRLWHGLCSELYKHKRIRRDYRATAPDDLSTLEAAGKLRWDSSKISPPDISYEQQESSAELSEFLDRLNTRLDQEARIILQELVSPRSWDSIPDEFKRNNTGDTYWRTPKKKIPQQILADLLDLPLTRLRRAIGRIRKQAKLVGEELNIKHIEAIQLGRRKRRKHVRCEDISSSAVLQS